MRTGALLVIVFCAACATHLETKTLPLQTEICLSETTQEQLDAEYAASGYEITVEEYCGL